MHQRFTGLHADIGSARQTSSCSPIRRVTSVSAPMAPAHHNGGRDAGDGIVVALAGDGEVFRANPQIDGLSCVTAGGFGQCWRESDAHCTGLKAWRHRVRADHEKTIAIR